MSNRVVITIELPDGVVPDVQYTGKPAQASDFVPDSVGTPFPHEDRPQPEFPPFPSQASSVPQCKVHGKAMKPGRGGGWYCPTKVGDGWCQEKA